jgi:hypothetical protein
MTMSAQNYRRSQFIEKKNSFMPREAMAHSHQVSHRYGHSSFIVITIQLIAVLDYTSLYAYE